MTEPTDEAERPTEGISELDRLVDEYRSRCLWFLRPDFYPRTTAEILHVLHEIEAHGDVQAFQRAGDIRRWLSRGSSESSVAS
jgi:hypothetical protein